MDGKTAPFGLVWAEGRDREIGARGGMPWSLPEDLAHFARLTTGCAVVMGRRTWESLPAPNRPLAGRLNVVLSSREDFQAPGALTARRLEEALDIAQEWAARRAADGAGDDVLCPPSPEGSLPAASAAGSPFPAVWVVGGARLYGEALRLPGARCVVVTEVDAAFPEADAFAPDFRADGSWRLAKDGPWRVSKTGLRYRVRAYRR